jgi:hypothetical protein
MCFTKLSGLVLCSLMLLVSRSADFHIPPKDVNLCRVRSLSHLRSFHMLQLEIVEVCDGIRLGP